jgi:hypothetical protein
MVAKRASRSTSAILFPIGIRVTEHDLMGNYSLAQLACPLSIFLFYIKVGNIQSSLVRRLRLGTPLRL